MLDCIQPKTEILSNALGPTNLKTQPNVFVPGFAEQGKKDVD